MPFDRFVVEQLAGDELVPPPHANLAPEAIDRLTATGFLRMAPDGTTGGGDDESRNRVVAEYALRGLDKPIGISEYELTRTLPRELQSSLPTIEAIETELTESPPEKPSPKRLTTKKTTKKSGMK